MTEKFDQRKGLENTSSSPVLGLLCGSCDTTSPIIPTYNCPHCNTPGLEVSYNYSSLRDKFMQGSLSMEGNSMWRYKDFLPCAEAPRVGEFTGATPFFEAKNLGRQIGSEALYVKDDSTNRPTLSYKDRVVSTAINKAIEFGFESVGCVSTGNVANSTSALAAEAGLKAFVLVPDRTEQGKMIGSLVYGANVVRVKGSYDDANKLCKELVSSDNKIGVVNVNLRSYYSEGAKTIIYEMAESLGWKLPKHIVLPLAGATLLIKAAKAISELQEVGLLDKSPIKLYGAQAAGSSPIANAFEINSDTIVPVEPITIATSLSIGNPGDGLQALRLVRKSGGAIASVTDNEILNGMQLLAKTEGVFAEAAGGTTVAVTKKLIESGVIPRDESTGIVITGNGYKTPDPIRDRLFTAIRDINCDLGELKKALNR